MALNLFIRAQKHINYHEDKVPQFELPDPLVMQDGTPVSSMEQWTRHRRGEIIDLFEEHVYGARPGEIALSSYQVMEEDQKALGGKALRKQIKLVFKKGDHYLEALVLMYLPHQVDHAPLFLGLNFFGNHTVIDDPQVMLTSSWMRNNFNMGIKEHKATDDSRGQLSHRWAIDRIIDSGFGVVTMYCGDIDPDRDDFNDGIHPFLYREGQTHPQPNEWGTLAAWSWGLSRALDYLKEDPHTSDSKVIAMGHSRLGKSALWAGAQDTRFHGVISNDSGCGGAALSKRKFGENAKAINANFPHWFCDNFKNYNGKEEELPLDQHMLMALIAPRPLYIASAEKDIWADPKGEFLSGVHATVVYKFFGMEGLSGSELPPVDQPIHHTVGYHIRSGKHEVTDYDWEQYILWAQKVLDLE